MRHLLRSKIPPTSTAPGLGTPEHPHLCLTGPYLYPCFCLHRPALFLYPWLYPSGTAKCSTKSSTVCLRHVPPVGAMGLEMDFFGHTRSTRDLPFLSLFLSSLLVSLGTTLSCATTVALALVASVAVPSVAVPTEEQKRHQILVTCSNAASRSKPLVSTSGASRKPKIISRKTACVRHVEARNNRHRQRKAGARDTESKGAQAWRPCGK